MINFFVENKPRMFNVHVIHTGCCELLPTEKSSLEPLIAEHIDGAIALAGLRFEQVRACSICSGVAGRHNPIGKGACDF